MMYLTVEGWMFQPWESGKRVRLAALLIASDAAFKIVDGNTVELVSANGSITPYQWQGGNWHRA